MSSVRPHTRVPCTEISLPDEYGCHAEESPLSHMREVGDTMECHHISYIRLRTKQKGAER